MNVTILAANGQITRLVEDRLLNEEKFKNVNLTLMLRRANRLVRLAKNSRVTLVEGDVTNPADIIKATKDADLVWLAVVDHDDTNRPTKGILAAAKKNGFTRIVETSLLGLYNEVPGEFGRWNREYCFDGEPTGTAPVLADQMLVESGLDYTTLRLPWLNDRPEVKYTLTHRHDEFIGVSASRQSIADVVCRIIADPTLGSHDSLGIGDPDTQGENRPVY
ncbi:MAG: NAD(P)H-binding protein [Limosilactobacillus gorillae]|uniref:NAD(P)H-binding protein n=1 Tax=Limosilactobacillus gorillae TaxID=1450649 RepID=UPI000A7E01D2|nr:NAD(P)H-binding protein [Limosilactobacillus gorillae]MDO4855193.1 NAD(P)H-binding protein [Limosilactobacillus gorillae]